MIERIGYQSTQLVSDEAIASLVDLLSASDGVERQAAREQLEEIGAPAAPSLLEARQSPKVHSRWEAAKALGRIRDVRAAPALVGVLADEEAAVRWLAASALAKLGRDALVPLLRGLMSHSDSIWFRDGAHHVLSDLTKEGVADDAIPVLEALEDLEPRIEAPVAAYHVLEDLRERGETDTWLVQASAEPPQNAGGMGVL